jgi:hypothetical protein
MVLDDTGIATIGMADAYIGCIDAFQGNRLSPCLLMGSNTSIYKVPT